MNNRRTGKIARLPKAVRDTVNVMLRDGATYPQVIAKLAELGHPGFNAENISNWFEGGFVQWEKEQERIEEIQKRSEISLGLVQALKKEGEELHITEANEILLASQLNDLLTAFDTSALKTLLNDNPSQYLKLAKAVSTQSSERTKRQKVELEYQKYQEEVAEKKRQIQAELDKARGKEGGLSPETINLIQEKLNLL